MKKTNFLKYLFLIAVCIFTATLFSKEITDDNGKVCHTFKVDDKMVEFVRIKGDKVLLYKEQKMAQPLLTLKNKSFVQYLDRDGKLIKIRMSDGINSTTDGWITKYQVFNSNNITTFYYGDPFEIENEKEIKIKDVELNKTAWIIKDVTKLYYEPFPDSDYKYEIYFGLRLEIKKQRGDYYFVQIYNSILQEYRSGWVRSEDAGTYEYFFEEYKKRRVEYDLEIANLNTEIGELESFMKNTDLEVNKYLFRTIKLNEAKTEILKSIADLKAEKRANEDEETRLRNDKIEQLEKQIAEFNTQNEEINKEMTELEKVLNKATSDIEKNTGKIAELKNTAEAVRSGKIEPAQVVELIAPENTEFSEEKESAQIAVKTPKTEESNKCDPVKEKLDAKMAEFESIRSQMSGQITKEEYNKLYQDYMDSWTEIGKIKKELSECETYSKTKHIALYNEALGLKKDEEYDDALELLYEAIEIKEDFEEAYYQIVSILILQEDDKTINDYIDKISDPEQKGKLYYKRAISVRNQYPKNAIMYLQTMAKFYKPALAYYQIGLIYSEKYSDFDNSIKFLKKSIEIDYEDPKTLEALGAAYLELKPPKGQDKNYYFNDAVSYLEKAYKNSEGYRGADILCARLSQAYNLLGKTSSALKYADLALEKTYQKPFGFGHLEKAKALIKMEKLSEARTHLKEAMTDITTKNEAEYWLNEIGK